MARKHRWGSGTNLLVLLAAWVACAGCHHTQAVLAPDVPRELTKVDLPDYVIEPPDVLVIDALRVTPRPPYRIEPLDGLALVVTETLPEQPISGVYLISPEGAINLGFTYGQVPVVGLTLEQSRAAIEKHLKPILKPGYQVTLALAQTRAMQQVRGEHLIRTDGTVVLGSYGPVRVAGLTVPDAKAVIEDHLSQFLLNPEISLDVSGYNSKVFYVITDGGGAGEQVVRVPLTGHDTVLDAISYVNGLSPVSSKKCIWVARPAPAGLGQQQVMQVDWVGLSQHGLTATNYQLMPGDRVYVKAQSLVTLDTFLARAFSPLERIFGITLLGSATVRSFDWSQNSGFGGGFGGGF